MKKTYIVPATDCMLVDIREFLMLSIRDGETNDQWVKGEKAGFEDIWGSDDGDDAGTFDF